MSASSPRQVIRTVFLLSLFAAGTENICSQNIAVNITGDAAAAANMFEVTQPAAAPTDYVSIFAKNLSTGTNAYAIWAEATGATNKYAIVVPSGGGNVGIGTITPTAKLHVVDNANNGTAAAFYQTNATASNGLYIQTQTASANDMALWVRPNNGSTEGIIVRNSGNVGIGTSAPGSTLEVKGTGATLMRLWPALATDNNVLTFGAASATLNRAKIYSTGSGGDADGDLRFATGLANVAVDPAMVIRSSGKVGIGTAGPDGLLQVASASGLGRQIIAGGPTVWSKGWADMSSNVSGDGVFGGNMYTDWNPATYRYSETHGSIGAMGFAVNYPGDSQASVITSGTTSSTAGTSFTPTAIAVFDYSGKVSIGTTSLASRFYVRDNTSRQIAAYDWLDMSSTGGGYGMVGGNAYMNWSDNTFRYAQTHGSIGGIGLVTNYPSWNQASMFSSGTTSSTGGSSFTPTLIAVFDYSGKVGIGTPSPATKLDVQGTSGTTLKIVDGNQGAGKVLTSDAAGVASWSNGPYATGSGAMVMLYNDETSAGPYTTTTTNIKSYTIPATYTKVKVEAEVEDDGNTAGNWTFSIVYNGSAVRTVPMNIVTTGNKNVITFSYTGAVASGQVVRIDATQTSGKNVFVKNFRVYGIY